MTQENPEFQPRAKPRGPRKLRIPGCTAAQGPSAPRAVLPNAPEVAAPEPGRRPLTRPATPPGPARGLPGLVVSSGWECPLWNLCRRLGAEVARARVRSARAGRRGRRSRQLGACGTRGRGGAGAPERGPPWSSAWGARPRRGGVSRAGLRERGAGWSELGGSRDRRALVSAGPRAVGGAGSRAAPRGLSPGRSARAAAPGRGRGVGSPARAEFWAAGGGGGGVFPRLLPLLFSWPRPSAASGRGGWGARRQSLSPRSRAVALLKSTVAPSSRTPGRPAVGGFPAGDACRMARLKGRAHGGSAA